MYFYELDLRRPKIDLSCTMRLIPAAKGEVQSRTVNLMSTYYVPGTVLRALLRVYCYFS